MGKLQDIRLYDESKCPFINSLKIQDRQAI